LWLKPKFHHTRIATARRKFTPKSRPSNFQTTTSFQVVKLSSHQTFKSPNFQTLKRSVHQAFQPSRRQVANLSSCQTFKPPNFQTVKLSKHQNFRTAKLGAGIRDHRVW
jgi:hypothetical protein